MGVQTTSQSALAAVNREDQWSNVAQASELVRKSGIQRLSMDLMFGLPNQTIADWHEDLFHITSLSPDSIVTYDCIYRGQGRRLISDVTEPPAVALLGKMYDIAYNYLTGHGYHADYGSVNFSLHPGETGTSEYFERRLLWGEDYVGIGNYASSLLGGRWMFNRHNIDSYIESVLNGTSSIEYHYSLPSAELYAKYLLYSLNFGKIMPEHFNKLFGNSLLSAYKRELQFAEKAGWINIDNNCVTIATGQFANMYQFRSLLYSDAAKQWFRALCEE